MRILFQGDSITDGNRGRGIDPNHIIGHSYPYPIASYLGFKYPEKGFEFLSRGVSGDTVELLYQRRQSDIFDLKPDVLSVLIGVNDALKRLDNPEMTAENFEKTYRGLISDCVESNSGFDAAVSKAPVSYWIWDSVHPTYNGHGLIADAFLNVTREIFE